jgi:hypothetical protein
MVFAYRGVQMKRIRIWLALGFTVLFSVSGYAQETWTSRGDNILTYRYKNFFSAGPLTIALEDSGKYLASAGNTPPGSGQNVRLTSIKSGHWNVHYEKETS